MFEMSSFDTFRSFSADSVLILPCHRFQHQRLSCCWYVTLLRILKKTLHFVDCCLFDWLLCIDMAELIWSLCVGIGGLSIGEDLVSEDVNYVGVLSCGEL